MPQCVCLPTNLAPQQLHRRCCIVGLVKLVLSLSDVAPRSVVTSFLQKTIMHMSPECSCVYCLTALCDVMTLYYIGIGEGVCGNSNFSLSKFIVLCLYVIKIACFNAWIVLNICIMEL